MAILSPVASILPSISFMVVTFYVDSIALSCS
jgi:hypothetical protein